ncbi:MAG: MSMEG_4193 family putative phosphomutase [Caldilineae bacterium]|nr:MSMEG_4193 family putative phosphomutase [Chloroflexota bacterium]MCB9175807.1 MSMEG_4193 family putative phosphomutase [Caldilineae bacterium]
MTQLLLVRHATNDWVGSQRLAGRRPGVHLNARGRAEAAALAARLDGYPIAAVYASPLERTRETAAWLAAPRGLPVLPLEGVLEIDFGDWEGQALETLRKDPLWAGVQHAPSQTRFPGGETLAEAQTRALAALEGLRRAHPEGVIAVVSHADVIKAVVAHYSGVHIDLFQRFDVKPASVSVVRFTAERPMVLAVNALGPIPPPPEAPSADPESPDAETASRPA